MQCPAIACSHAIEAGVDSMQQGCCCTTSGPTASTVHPRIAASAEPQRHLHLQVDGDTGGSIEVSAVWSGAVAWSGRATLTRPLAQCQKATQRGARSRQHTPLTHTKALHEHWQW